MATSLTKSSALECHCTTPTARGNSSPLVRHSHLQQSRTTVKIRIKEYSCQGLWGKKRALRSNRHTSGPGVERTGSPDSPVQPGQRWPGSVPASECLCGVICPGFGQDGIFPSLRNRGPGSQPPPKAPARVKDFSPRAVTPPQAAPACHHRLKSVTPAFLQITT